MLRIMKNTGNVYSRANDASKGDKGRIEMFLNRTSEGKIEAGFIDFGNYGKNRWDATAVISEGDLDTLIATLQAFKAQELQNTLTPFVEPVKAEKAPKAKAAETVDAAPAEAPTEVPALQDGVEIFEVVKPRKPRAKKVKPETTTDAQATAEQVALNEALNAASEGVLSVG